MKSPGRLPASTSQVPARNVPSLWRGLCDRRPLFAPVRRPHRHGSHSILVLSKIRPTSDDDRQGMPEPETAEMLQSVGRSRVKWPSPDRWSVHPSSMWSSRFLTRGGRSVRASVSAKTVGGTTIYDLSATASGERQGSRDASDQGRLAAERERPRGIRPGAGSSGATGTLLPWPTRQRSQNRQCRTCRRSTRPHCE
jgi:hypothetical protein